MSQIAAADITPALRSHALRLVRVVHGDNGYLRLTVDGARRFFGGVSDATVRRHLGHLQAAGILHYTADDAIRVEFCAWYSTPRVGVQAPGAPVTAVNGENGAFDAAPGDTRVGVQAERAPAGPRVGVHGLDDGWELWPAVLASLSRTVQAETFQGTLLRTRAERDGDTVTVLVVSAPAASYLEARLGPKVRRAVAQAAGRELDVQFRAA
jgi:hypothetical protein